MIKPCSYHVLVRPDVVEEKTKTGIFIPSGTQQREQFAQVFGTIVKIGPTAWNAFDSGEKWAEVGDRVAYARYGGFLIRDPETKEDFRLLLDKDIVAVVSGKCEVINDAVAP